MALMLATSMPRTGSSEIPPCVVYRAENSSVSIWTGQCVGALLVIDSVELPSE